MTILASLFLAAAMTSQEAIITLLNSPSSTSAARYAEAVSIVKRDADAGKPKKELSVLAPGAQNRGRFHNSESTLWHGENVDEPTYLRKNITLDF